MGSLLEFPFEFPFPHRLNRDGTYDSICQTCFNTVGTGRTEAELAQAEKRHQQECPGPPRALFRRIK
jgi:hypothetical protein